MHDLAIGVSGFHSFLILPFPNIKVYDAHEGECEWCTLSFVTTQFYDIIPNITYPLNHSLIYIYCSKDDSGFWANVNPNNKNKMAPHTNLCIFSGSGSFPRQ
jgi:hypothetical protein